MYTVKILENLSDMGCDDKQICFMKKMYKEGDTDMLLRNLRKCRCNLMDELHASQKKVDNMDFLIRQIQNAVKIREALKHRRIFPTMKSLND